MGYWMPSESYQLILNEAYQKKNEELQRKNAQSMLQQCLDKDSIPEESHRTEWVASGFALGILTSIAIMYSLK